MMVEGRGAQVVSPQSFQQGEKAQAEVDTSSILTPGCKPGVSVTIGESVRIAFKVSQISFTFELLGFLIFLSFTLFKENLFLIFAFE